LTTTLKPLTTTVVGSFPAVPGKDTLMTGYRTGNDPYLDSIRESVEAQTSAGIEIISDGQTRNDMIKLFTTKLHGIRMKLKPVVIGDIGYRYPITIKDQKFIKTLMTEDQLLKGIVTGPYTLAKSCVDDYYGSSEKLAYAFAEALNEELRLLDGIVDIIQVDEPFLSIDFPPYAKDLVSIIFKGVEKPRALHICGDVGGVFEDLLDFQVDILDHEFAAHPDLLGIVGDLESDKIIGFGCVRSDVDEVESVDVILERIKKGKDSIGDERMLLDPDCGLKHVSSVVARQNLSNMVKARNVIRDEG